MIEQEILISCTELRTVIRSIVEVVSETSGVSVKKISLRSSINNDLGIQGDDLDAIADFLHEKYHCNLSELNFYDYFIDEGQITNRLFVLTLYLPWRITGFILTWPFSRRRAFKFWRKRIFARHPDVTVGDLVTSAIARKWKPRREVKYRLVPPLSRI